MEYTTIAFRTAPGAKVIGSTTAGADGNVSTIPLPDVKVLPTIAGLRDGRDEVLEEAIRQILKD
jgi:hypothetical protein